VKGNGKEADDVEKDLQAPVAFAYQVQPLHLGDVPLTCSLLAQTTSASSDE
jgi:hypothetical protein